MTTQLEVRDAAVAWPDIDMEVRAVDGGLEFRGYAAVFDSWSADLGGFRETIKPGAFTKSINSAANGSADVKMFLNHNQDVVLASTKAKTLRLAQDERGLLAEASLPDSVWGHPVAEAIKRGDISSMSFGFAIPGKRSDGGLAQEWSTDHKERTLNEVRLFEVSPVTGWPAYSATSASVRSLVDIIDWDDEEAARAVLDGLSEPQRSTFLRLLAPAPIEEPQQPTTPQATPSVAGLLARLEAKKRAA